MHVLFIYPFTVHGTGHSRYGIIFPVGMVRVANEVEKKGNSVEIFDIRDAENTVKLTLELLKNIENMFE